MNFKNKYISKSDRQIIMPSIGALFFLNDKTLDRHFHFQRWYHVHWYNFSINHFSCTWWLDEEIFTNQNATNNVPNKKIK